MECLGVHGDQACKLKFRLTELTSCLRSAPAPAVFFKGGVAGVEATETGTEFSQLKYLFTSLFRKQERIVLFPPPLLPSPNFVDCSNQCYDETFLSRLACRRLGDSKLARTLVSNENLTRLA